MKIADTLYGDIELPDWLGILISSPIVQRLRWISLSNVSSLTYPMIGGVSRYAHALGTAHLARVLCTHIDVSDSKHKAFICASLLHDSGMPPLGHLTEEAFGMADVPIDHEATLRNVLLGGELRFQQMPGGRNVNLTKALESIRVDANHVLEIILGRSELGSYLNADIDLDNIDNVARMYRQIRGGHGYDPEHLVVSHYVRNNSSSKREWEKVRFLLYSDLMFSIPDFAQKATIKRLVKEFVLQRISDDEGSKIVSEIGLMHDQQFLNVIYDTLHSELTDVRLGVLDRVVWCGWHKEMEIDVIGDLALKICSEFPSYYIDYIPDKRVKDRSGNFGNGALIGVFCKGRGRSVADQWCRKELLSSGVSVGNPEKFVFEEEQQQDLF